MSQGLCRAQTRVIRLVLTKFSKPLIQIQNGDLFQNNVSCGCPVLYFSNSAFDDQNYKNRNQVVT